jgi:hypothetical protein
MFHRLVGIACAVLILTGGLAALQEPRMLTANGTLKKIDADNGTMVVFAGGQDRNLKIDKSVKVLDMKGQDLPDGLKSKELKEGAEVTITVETGGGQPVLKAIRLGHHGGNNPQGGKPGGGTATGGKSSVGFKPLTEMSGSDKYKGEDGGLYGSGKNEPPAAHQEAARKETAKIVPLDADGKPSGNGKIVLISISMSNATQEFSKFKQIADADAQKSKQLTVVDCAQGGQAMAQWAPPNAKAWEVAEQRLQAAGVSNKQVQVCWIKLANPGPRGELIEHAKKLENDTLAVVHNAKARFPNLRIAYLSSRIYGGYAGTQLNPEPYAYEGAFAVRWLIQDQIKGNSELNYDSGHGSAKAPLLLWGPYFWADGMTPRKSDGLVWERTDLGGDGTHPSEAGRQKVAELILKFFKTDENAKTWFVKGTTASTK